MERRNVHPENDCTVINTVVGVKRENERRDTDGFRRGRSKSKNRLPGDVTAVDVDRGSGGKKFNFDGFVFKGEGLILFGPSPQAHSPLARP